MCDLLSDSFYLTNISEAHVCAAYISTSSIFVLNNISFYAFTIYLSIHPLMNVLINIFCFGCVNSSVIDMYIHVFV